MVRPCCQNGRSAISEEKLIHEGNALHLLEDLHHEAVNHARHLRCSTLVGVLCTFSGIAHGQDRRQLLGAGYFGITAEWRRDRKRPWRVRPGCCRQIQRTESHCRCRSEHVEGPPGAAQRTVPLPEESWRQQPGRRAQRGQPGPEHPHPEEGHNEVHGGAGVPAMLGSLGQCSVPVRAPRERTTTNSYPASHLDVK